MKIIFEEERERQRRVKERKSEKRESKQKKESERERDKENISERTRAQAELYLNSICFVFLSLKYIHRTELKSYGKIRKGCKIQKERKTARQREKK